MNSLRNSIFAFLSVCAMSCAVSVSAQPEREASAVSPQHSKKAMRIQNRQLEKKIRHALTKIRDLDSAGVVILVKSASVVLVGTVPDEGQIQIAGNAAKSVPGVIHVKNNLIVAEPGN